MKVSKRKRFEIWLTMHPRDRKIAAWVDAQPNASEAAKTVLAKHIEKEEGQGNG